MGMKFRITTIFLLLAILAAGVHAQSGKKKRKSILKKAKEHLSYEEFQAAIPHIQQLLEEDEQNAYYNFWMGKCLYLTYKKNQALPYFETVENVNPDVDDAFHYYYGLTLHYNLAFDKAIEEYRKDLERYDSNSDEYRNINNRISQCLYAKKATKKREADLVRISNMGDRINSEYAEHSPVISADNQTLVYTARRPDSRGAEPDAHFYDEDIYVSKNTGNGWSEGTNIGTPVNSKGHDATISLTADGKTLYIYRHKKQGGLYVTEFDDEGKKWKEPRLVEKPLNSKHYEASICQSADSSKLFFTSDRPGGFGGLDIYMVKKDERGKWGDPQNLGPQINTPFNEDAPFFHSDGRTLYYSSDGPNGMGGYDIFVTEMDATGAWLPALNMGPPINTPDDEIYFVLAADGLSGYYASGMEGGLGEKDIYQIKFPYFRYPKRYYVIEVVGVVQDVNTLDTLPSIVRLVDTEANQVVDSFETDAASAQYNFVLEPERSYSLQVDADGYARVVEEFTAPEIKGDDVTMERNLFVSKPAPPPVVVEAKKPEIQHIYFNFDKSSLRSDAKDELERVAELLAENESVSVEIMGHTDWYGTYDYNVALSERRTNSAMKYLAAMGLGDRVKQNWFSENQPIQSNESDEGRQFNRRCEFRFYSDEGDLLFSSVRLRKGVETIDVDHAIPKGAPGFDNPEGLETDGISMVSDDTYEQESQTIQLVAMNEEIVSGPAGSVPERAEVAAARNAMDDLELQHIYFDFDDFGLKNASETRLEKMVSVLKSNPEYRLLIQGHTDSKGSDDYNQRLSENRCQSAYDYLIDAGVPVEQLALAGYSEALPIASNSDAAGRQANRRVEFELQRKGRTVLRSQP